MLNKAIIAAKAGRKTEARHLLEAVLDADERNEQAWLWLSGAVDSNEERVICLENVLAINPDNQAARKGLAALRAATSAPIILPLAPPSPVASAGYSPPATAPLPAAVESTSKEDVVTSLLGRIEQQHGQAAVARPIPNNRVFIIITICLILLLVCSVIGILIFSALPAT